MVHAKEEEEEETEQGPTNERLKDVFAYCLNNEVTKSVYYFVVFATFINDIVVSLK